MHYVQHVLHTASENIFPVGLRTLAYLADAVLKTAPNPVKQEFVCSATYSQGGFPGLLQNDYKVETLAVTLKMHPNLY